MLGILTCCFQEAEWQKDGDLLPRRWQRDRFELRNVLQELSFVSA